ncbi:11904_t:CDS:2 [Diversispora eburnea]|uniref:11904_t:CDS:1 n=1 Tax=Diversispora eburnea TaxID=1213867 RepID=A0A9N9A5U5_9GLOM|nr:11904_t:CDS:2 [Diversispora eburnea]
MSEADAPNGGSDQFSQDNEDRHRDINERHRDERDVRHHDTRRHEDRDERINTPSRSRSRSPLNRSRSPRDRSVGDRNNSEEEEDLNPGNNLFVTGLSSRTGDHADIARENINGTEINGRVLTVERARRARARTPTPGRYYGPPKRREPRRVDRFDPRYEYSSRPYDRYERPPRGGGYGREPYYDRAYDRSYYDRGYERSYDRAYDRAYDRGYDRDRRPPPPTRYETYPRPRSPYN